MKVIQTRSEKLLYFMFRMIIYHLKSIGLAPISPHTETLAKNSCTAPIRGFVVSKVGLFYNIVLSILVPIVGTLGLTVQFSAIYRDGLDISEAIDLILYTYIIVAAWFIIIYWSLRQKKAVDIINRLLDVRCIFPAPKCQLSNKWILLFLGIHMIFNFILWITLTIVAMIHSNSLWLAIIYNTPPLVLQWLFMEYSMVLELIAREFENLNNNLLTLKELPNYLFHTNLSTNNNLAITISSTDDKLVDIKLLHNVRTSLFQVSNDVADFFSIPILLCVACIFLGFVTSAYFLILPTVTSTDDSSFFENIYNGTWLIGGNYLLILLAFNVTKTTKKAGLTKQLVDKLTATAKNEKIKAELEQFSLQLVHEKLSFNAYGFFELDFTLLQSTFGATATYLVILLQFAQSNTN